MTASNIWLLIAAIVAGVAAVLRLEPTDGVGLGRLGAALSSAALALVAIALIIALP
jgi:hypothetical protein